EKFYYEVNVPTRWQEMKPVGDFIANAVILGTLLQWLPVAAANLSLIWGAMRIYETYLDIRKKRALSWNPAVTATPEPVLPTVKLVHAIPATEEKKETPDANK